MCSNGGPKSIGKQKQKLCHLVLRLAKHRVQRRRTKKKEREREKRTGLET